ncbi:MAG: methyltransferase domain-containing protein [Bryobacteraceae bacterium]|nr:methyltransferase domain-containing protein [Bryobacteraceae bacterium]
MNTPSWDAQLYLRFSKERTQAAIDLVARIQLAGPRRIVDLGCGPGNSTAVLRARWPQAEITGLDQSAEMLAEARRAFPGQAWLQADISAWTADQPYDLVYSNAAIQWVHGHARLMPHLLEQVAPGGALAVQIPAHSGSPLHLRMRQIALDERWRERMGGAINSIVEEPPAYYYDLLAPRCLRLELWETEYIHVLDSVAAIVEFIRGTGLRPYLEALGNEPDRELYLSLLAGAIAHDYPQQADGKVLFPFRRLFFIAYR